MDREQIDQLWNQATRETLQNGELNERYHFAKLVAAHEREECAKVCETRFMGDLNREDMEARRCASDIRARGNT